MKLGIGAGPSGWAWRSEVRDRGRALRLGVEDRVVTAEVVMREGAYMLQTVKRKWSSCCYCYIRVYKECVLSEVDTLIKQVKTSVLKRFPSNILDALTTNSLFPKHSQTKAQPFHKSMSRAYCFAKTALLRDDRNQTITSVKHVQLFV